MSALREEWKPSEEECEERNDPRSTSSSSSSNKQRSGVKGGRKNKRWRLGVVVVESHHHALEHVHWALRRRRSLPSWTLLHYDSHPDMACPGEHISAAACFTPRRRNSTGHDADGKNLYELLDATNSGIAEWIIPLCFASGLSLVYWTKSAWATQFTTGTYSFHVGAHAPTSTNKPCAGFWDLPPDAPLKVDLVHPYYLDDRSVVATQTLLLKQNIQFIVQSHACHFFDHVATNANYTDNGDNNPSLTCNSDLVHADWILDICLDYFACQNPFVVDLEVLDLTFTQVFLRVATEPSFRTTSKATCPNNSCSTFNDIVFRERYEKELATFHQLMTVFLNYYIQQKKPSASNHSKELEQSDPSQENPTISVSPPLTSKQEEELYALYVPPSGGEKLIQTLQSILESHSNAEQLATMALDALPNITVPYDTMNDEKSLLESALEQVRLMGKTLTRYWSKQPPMIVTIARSSIDGFTPAYFVEELQRAVLNEVHAVYCGCDRLPHNNKEASPFFNVRRSNVVPTTMASECVCHIIFDYGGREGSTLDDE